jgi:transcriptional regulator with XRE-family HTH domain
VTEFTETDAEIDKLVKETVADNVRAYRHLRRLDQAGLARRMYSFGMFPWSRVTVSEVERGERNVTVAELFGLAFTLATTIEHLLDTRGPERKQGPRMALYDKSEDPTERRFHVALRPEVVAALVCATPPPGTPHLIAEWDDNWLSHVHIVESEPRP